MKNENITTALTKLPLGATIGIFTDGASKNNPGPAGYGLVIVHDGEVIHEASGSLGIATNVYAEMTAAIEALTALQARPDLVVTVLSDNQMLIRGMTEWLAGWKAKNWRGSKRPVANRPLWETLDGLAANLPNLTWKWMRGHDGNSFNDMADVLASEAAVRSREVA